MPSDYFSFLTWGLELYHKAVKTESTEEAELLYRVSGASFVSIECRLFVLQCSDCVCSGEEYESAHLLNPKNDDILNNWGCTLDMRARLKKGMLAEQLYHEYVTILDLEKLSLPDLGPCVSTKRRLRSIRLR